MSVPNYWQRKYSRRTALRGAGAFGLLGALAAAGCGDDDDSNGSSGAATTGTGGDSTGLATPTPRPATPVAQPVNGGTITFNYGAIAQLDWMTSTPWYQTAYAARLLRYTTGPDIDPGDYEKIERDLAISWEQPDQQTIALKIDPNAKFHDKAPVNGRPVTSTDVKETFALLGSDKPSYVWQYIPDTFESIDTPSDDTVVFRTKYPTPLLLSLLAYYNSAIAPTEIIERDGNLQKNDIGAGPFIVDEFQPNQSLKLVKNPDYWAKDQGLPYLDGVNLITIADENSQLDALRAGQLDAHDIGLTLLAAAQSTLPESQFTFQQSPGIAWAAYFYNPNKPPFDKLPVRQAMHYAIDRTAINQIVNQGRGKLRTSPLARGWTQWSRTDEEVLASSQRDVAKAKQLLEAAGYPDGFDVTWMYPGVNTRGIESAMQVIQQQLKDVNIRLTLGPVDSALANKRLQSGDFELGYWTSKTYPDPDDYLYPYYVPNGGKNYGFVDDPALTAIIEKQRQEFDVDARRELFQDLDRRWNDDFAYTLWTHEWPFSHFFHNRVQNYAGRNHADYSSLRSAWLKTS